MLSGLYPLPLSVANIRVFWDYDIPARVVFEKLIEE